jgi:hypothetical protein
MSADQADESEGEEVLAARPTVGTSAHKTHNNHQTLGAAAAYVRVQRILLIKHSAFYEILMFINSLIGFDAFFPQFALW